MNRYGKIGKDGSNSKEMTLNATRYARQIQLQEIGEEGQNKIKQAKILVVGAGGLGSPILYYLAAAGVGTIGIIDNDLVSESNLQRQILYDSHSLGLYKAEIAKQKLEALNPHCQIIAMCKRLTAENALEIIDQYDIVVDATDNLPTRYIMDDICRSTQTPLVYGSICEFQGQVSVFLYQKKIGYRELFPYPENMNQIQQPLGVIGTLPGIIGSIQATECLKIILGSSETLSGKLLQIDLLKNHFQLFTICSN